MPHTLPHFRFTLRRMMVIVAILAVTSLGAREVWSRWFRPPNSNPVYPSSLTANITDHKANQSWSPGQSISVSISYNFQFMNPRPKPGTSSLLLGMIWIADADSDQAIDCYSFDAPLAIGGREATADSFVWNARLTRPGRYMLSHALYHMEADGKLRSAGGGGSSFEVKADANAPAQTNNEDRP